jgi:4-amino-4-deoxy-L-arabinose transferase-like glycosyltransferase
MDEPLATSDPHRWWREPQLVVLVLMVTAIFFSRLTTLTIRGEESRRARVAVEILESGDWIVPTQQQQIYLSRPPLGSYPIALVGMWRGEVDALATRLPTVLAVLLTCVLIYGYGRGFLTANGALAAALAYATMIQVMELGRLAETEATFTLLVAASLLLWHAGYTHRWPAALFWSLGYNCAALAGLAKGPQGPIYFVAVTIAYLLWRRDWKSLFSLPHAVGIASFLLVLGAWQVPYFLSTNLESSLGIWVNNAAQRFEDNSRVATMLTHMATYPLEMFACLAPWSLLLLRYGDKRFRHELAPYAERILFLTLAILVTFPTVWLASTAKTRYFMPLYPCFALLVGMVIDRSLAAAPSSALRKVWRNYALVVSVAIVGFAAVVAVASWWSVPQLAMLAQSPAVALAFGMSVLLGAIVAVTFAQQPGNAAPAASVTIVAGMLGLSFTWILLNSYARSANDPAPVIAAVKQRLFSDRPLHSFCRVDHLFAYHYQTPIEYLPVPQTANEVPNNVEYFVLDGGPSPMATLPFEWETVETISLDRNRMDQPKRTVIIGRRLSESESLHVARKARQRTPSKN